MGLLDTMSAAGLRYKLIGLAFTVLGILLLTGCAVLLREPWRWKAGRVAAVAAGIAGALVGGYLLLMQYRAPAQAPSRLPPLPAWAPWASIVVASVAGAILGWRSTKDYADEQVTWTALGRRLVAGGLSVTVLFSGVHWWYTQQYQPGMSAAVLTVTTELQPAASSSDTSSPYLFEGTITVRNVSAVKVLIVASLYQVAKVTHVPRAQSAGINAVDAERQAMACFFEEIAPVTTPECNESGIREYGESSAEDPRASSDPLSSRTSQIAAIQILQLGQIVGDGSWLEPQEEFEHNVLVHVPTEQAGASRPDELRTLELSALLTVAEGSRLALEPVPSHGPEMVTEALMSNEEYRDYTQAQRDVMDPERVAAAEIDGTEEVGSETVEVSAKERVAYFQRLTMSTPHDEASLGLSAPEIAPRPYPHRYTVVEWPISDLSTVHRLVSGSQVVNTVRVLSMRTYNPLAPGAALAGPHFSALMEYELIDLVTCINPAGTLAGQDRDSEIRRDPTTVCPGMWYSLADKHGAVANDYERQYQEKADYGADMAQFYGLSRTGASDEVPLTTVEEAAAFTVPAPPQVHPLTSPAFQLCKPALEWADTLMGFYVDDPQGVNDMKGAFLRHQVEMQGSDDDQVPDGPTLADGVAAADAFGVYVDFTDTVLADCSAIEVTEGTPAADCTGAADAWISALRYARDLSEAMRTHLAVMQQLEREEISAQEAARLGRPSLEAGAAASSGFDQAVANAQGRVAGCR
ncbi:hypothetical protein ACI780_20905 [Geodermatophilus sp. SYSU D00814]